MLNFEKDILWIFSSTDPEKIPSYMLGSILPANYLKIKKVVFLDNHNPKKTLEYYNPKLIIVSKALHDKVVDLVKLAREFNIKVISIFDDWHFVDSLSRIFEKRFLRNELIAQNSDLIIAKTKTAADVIFQNTGIKANIVSDCLRFKSQDPIKKINYPFKISWFGMKTNHDTLEYGIKEILKYEFKIELKIITTKFDIIRHKLTKHNLKNISLNFVNWHQEWDQEVSKTDIVIIPYINDVLRLVKSPNRITDSLNLGKFVIMSKADQFNEFKNYCYFGNIGKGLEWLKNNEQLAIKMISYGQKYVQKKYSIKAISKIWEKLINKTII